MSADNDGAGRAAGAGAPAFVVAIDGPAASGKGTIARSVAARFDFAYLDTGVLYRAVAAKALEAGGVLEDADAMAAMAADLAAEDLHRADLRTGPVGAASSIVAAHPGVRSTLLNYQRFFAHSPAGGRAGAVLDGRDIGTVVCPAAQVKVFVTADLEERARRRHSEMAGRGEAATLDDVRADLAERDRRDATRAASPMTTPDAGDDARYLLDTTHLTIDQAVAAAVTIIEARLHADRGS